MTMNMISKRFNTFLTGSVDVETDTHSTIIINESPEGLSAAAIDETCHQLTSVMAFQENLAMLFRATLASQGTAFPITKGRFKLLVRLKSSRSISSLSLPLLKNVIPSSPLLNVLKSVLDGLNGQIISNDSLVRQAEITYEMKPRGQRSVLDSLEIELHDLAGGQQTLIVQVSTELYVVPKEPPIILDPGNAASYMHDTHHEEFADQLQPIMSLPKFKHYHIDAEFVGDVQRLDVDNMAKVYIPTFNKLGINDDDIHRITLRKQSKKTRTGSTIPRISKF